MKTKEEVYRFLKSLYKPSRFEESPDCRSFPDYTDTIVASVMESMAENGYSTVSRYESNSGEDVWFDEELNIIDGETAIKLMDVATAKHYGWV